LHEKTPAVTRKRDRRLRYPESSVRVWKTCPPPEQNRSLPQAEPARSMESSKTIPQPGRGQASAGLIDSGRPGPAKNPLSGRAAPQIPSKSEKSAGAKHRIVDGTENPETRTYDFTLPDGGIFPVPDWRGRERGANPNRLILAEILTDVSWCRQPVDSEAPSQSSVKVGGSDYKSLLWVNWAHIRLEVKQESERVMAPAVR